MLLDLTEAQVAELINCTNSPRYFLDTFGWLEQKETQQTLQFVPFGYQEEILAELVAGNNVLVNKSRRVGVSWIVAAYAAWLINFRQNISILFLSKREKDAVVLLDKVKFILDNLAYHDNKDHYFATKAPWLRGEVVTNNSLEYEIGYRDDEGNIVARSTVTSLSTTKEAGRSHGATIIFLDEFAFVKPDDERTWAAIKPTVARGGQWIIGSSPNGSGGVFHRLCMIGRRKENTTFWYREVHWSEAAMTLDIIKRSTEGMDNALVRQEWELEFIQSNSSVFSATDLAVCYKPPDEFPETKKYLEEYRGIYYSGVDTAVAKEIKGTGEKDYSSYIALTQDGVMAIAYHSKGSLGEWAGMTVDGKDGSKVERIGLVSKLHANYPGVLYVEENGPGHTVINRHRLPEDHTSEIHMGQTTHRFKSLAMQSLMLAIEGHQIIITDEFTYQCLLVFQRGDKPGTYMAPTGYYDDPVIALALAWYALLSYGTLEIDYNTNQAFVNRRKPLTAQELEGVIASEGPYIEAEYRRMDDLPTVVMAPDELDLAFMPALLPGEGYGEEDEMRSRRLQQRNQNW